MADKNQHPDGGAAVKKTDDSRDKIINREIEDEMKSSFIDYAMSVIVSRALPDVRDGLKPVHRRVLFGMNELGVYHNKPYKKSARIVGDVMGKYHPHGDSAIYETMVRMAQDFSLRYPLVEGQGNFGSVDGDNAAAMRYTEARLNKIAEELLLDIDKDTVDFVPNFDNSLKEPSVLPCKIPNLLINGSSGIAVGMATNIPPHNLREISNAMIAMIDNESIELKDIIGMVKGPDFPTGGTIMGRNGIISAFLTGKGKLIVRAKIGEEEKQGKKKLIVTEIPYQVNKSTLIEQVADQAKEKKIEGISDIRDETSHAGMRIVIELKKEANSQVVINQLYKHTLMQSSFGIIMLSLVNNEPKVLNLKEMIDEFISHRIVVVKRRTTFELDKAEKRVHIVKGLLIALKDIRKIVDLILKSKNTENAREQLMGNFPLDKIQADAILEMKLSRLTSLEQDKTKEEHDNLVKLIEELKGILADHKKILAIIKQEITEIRDKYGDNRRTMISDEELEYFDTIDLIKEEDQIVTISHQGYIKRIPMDTYKNQNRGGKGIIAAETKEDDFIEDLFVANTHSYLLFFTDQGIVKWLSVYKLPEAGRYSMGKAIVNLVALDEKEKISACIPVKDFDPNQFLLFVTKKGLVKKTSLVEFSRPRQGGIRAINLLEGDELIGCKLTSGKDKIMIGTAKGQAVLFDEEDVRPMGRSSQGVRGIRLGKDDHVVEMDIADEKKTVLTITENGFGKRTEVSEYREINRGGKGVINIQTTDRNGDVVSVKVVDLEDEIMIITQKGILIRTPVHGISVIGRNTQGVRLMKLDASDKVVSSAKIMRNGIEKPNGEKELIMKYGEQLVTEKQELNTSVSDNSIENTIEVDEEEKDDEEVSKDDDKNNSE